MYKTGGNTMEAINEFWLLIKYVVLGLLQGFTEPIPISSSGHLVIVRELFNVSIEGLSFEIMVNFGSLIAVLVIYRKDIYRLVENTIRYITTRAHDAKSDFQFVLPGDCDHSNWDNWIIVRGLYRGQA